MEVQEVEDHIEEVVFLSQQVEHLHNFQHMVMEMVVVVMIIIHLEKVEEEVVVRVE